MAKVGPSAGLLGLTHRPDKQAQAQQDLQTLDLMVQRKEQQAAQEQQAALIEQQYYDRLREEADKLLAPDRQKINSKAKQVQASISEKIKLFGGSRKKFMANGGMAMIGGYSDQILNSDELANYRNNKENMVKILDIKEKNLGHRLTAVDQANLEQYQRDGTGKISYSGLMNEIDIPDKDTELFGKKMTAVDIYKHKENFQKLVTNYTLEHPQEDLSKLTPEQLDRKMLVYAWQKGYGGVGNRILPQEDYGSGKNRFKTTADDVKPVNHTISTSLSTALAVQTQKSVNELSFNDFEQDPMISAIFGNKPFSQAGDNTAMFDGIKQGEVDGPVWRLKAAKEIKGGISQDLLKLVYGQDSYMFEGNKLKSFKPQNHNQSIYNAKGEKLNRSEAPFERDYTIVGTAMAWKGNFMNGEALVVEGLKNGKKEDTNISYKNEGDSPAMAKPTYVVMLKDSENGSVIYQEIDYSSLAQQTQLAAILKDRDNMAEGRDEGAEKMNTIRKEKMKATAEVEGVPTPDLPIDVGIFESDTFKAMGANYNRQDPTGNRREDLRKAYYMASLDFWQKNKGNYDMKAAVDSGALESTLNSLGLSEIFANPNVSDTQALQYFEQALNEDVTDYDQMQNNLNFVNMLKGYISKIRK